MRRDDEFLEPVKLALAKRASFVCSNPDCRALTVAPEDSSADRVLYIGKAAHIRAASPGGARYDASMTSEGRSSIRNGIFLCSNCADMVDRNGGTDFSVAVLVGWKDQHEKWVRSNLNKRADSPLTVVSGTHEAHGVGEVTGLDIEGPAIIRPGTVSRASGQGHITGTRIGPRRKG